MKNFLLFLLVTLSSSFLLSQSVPNGTYYGSTLMCNDGYKNVGGKCNKMTPQEAEQQRKQMAKPETKTVTRTVAVPKTKVVTQQPQQQTTPKDAEPTDFTPIRPQPPLPNQQDSREKR